MNTSAKKTGQEGAGWRARNPAAGWLGRRRQHGPDTGEFGLGAGRSGIHNFLVQGVKQTGRLNNGPPIMRYFPPACIANYI